MRLFDDLIRAGLKSLLCALTDAQGELECVHSVSRLCCFYSRPLPPPHSQLPPASRGRDSASTILIRTSILVPTFINLRAGTGSRTQRFPPTVHHGRAFRN